MGNGGRDLLSEGGYAERAVTEDNFTRLTLGVDRDSEIVAHVFDERDQAVRTLIAQAIQHARRLGRKIGLCGQAPSDYPAFAKFPVECGIDSMSLNPDAVLATTQTTILTLGAGMNCYPCDRNGPCEDGSSAWTRTRNPPVNSRMLYH